MHGQAERKFKPWDSLRYYVNKDNGAFLLGFDGTNSYINGTSTPVVGLRYGLGYKKIAIYSGYYTSKITSSRAEDTQTVNYSFINTGLDYYLHRSWRYDVFVPMRIGYGNKLTETINSKGEYIVQVQRFVPMDLGIGGSVRFLRYLGIGGATGYRWSIYQGKGYTAPYWNIGFFVYTGTIWRDAKKTYKKFTQ